MLFCNGVRTNTYNQRQSKQPDQTLFTSQPANRSTVTVNECDGLAATALCQSHHHTRHHKMTKWGRLFSCCFFEAACQMKGSGKWLESVRLSFISHHAFFPPTLVNILVEGNHFFYLCHFTNHHVHDWHYRIVTHHSTALSFYWSFAFNISFKYSPLESILSSPLESASSFPP